ncbi:MAG: hypothetical protein A3G76_16410 [Acidobacteria bacterium RIFCSPLOWO2_12_FULL_65_11]|nr:MAG: hypothetical protein A3G76_16410 [Acidobacteria bacterium RIFCSPLOWO2_12_FULL_65_11]
MRTSLVKLSAVLVFVALTAYAPAAAPPMALPAVGPSLASLGPVVFAADGTMFAGDTQAATIFAIDLGAQANGGAPGTADVANINQKIAAMLGTDAGQIAITDLAVHPRTRNSFISVMRGQGPAARPAIVRVDGAGQLTLVATERLTYTSVALPNAPEAANQRNNSITDLAFANGRVYVAGLSNEEFASKLWSVGYPFTTADNGTSVEIYHGNHRRLETRAPIYAFIPYTINNQQYIIASYTCTPLVKFPVSQLAPGAKFRGETIGEFGAGNRPLDMIRYQKGGKEFLLMSNTSRGIMKVPTDTFATAAPITSPVETETGGVPYEKVTSMTGVVQLDLLDATRSIVISGTPPALNLTSVALP